MTLPGNSATLTPEQRQARAESSVRLAAGMTAKGILIALSDKDAADAAKIVDQVARDILDITANDTVDLTAIRQIVSQRIAAMKATAKQRLIASQIVDAIALVVQEKVDLLEVDGGDQTQNAIRLVRFAAQGAQDAAAIFLFW